MKQISVENAVGTVLAHDVTRILPGEFKGVAFKKGHVIRPEDIPELIGIGKKHLYILELSAGELHEDEAALRIARAVSGPGLTWTSPSEGKSSIITPAAGLLKVDVAGLRRINRLGSLIIVTLKNNYPCRAGQTVAATRIIPLTIAARKIEKLEAAAARFNPVLAVKPFRPARVGAVITGSEIYEGLMPDGFDQTVGAKIRQMGCELAAKRLAPDDPAFIARTILELKDLGCEIILTTGGLSVDPDDVTRQGVRKTGARTVFYGTPVLPGAMFLYSILDNCVILGLPACVYYHHVTVFDLIFPRILAGESVSAAEISEMGHGGLCLNCEVCRYPACPFGK